MRLLRLDVLKEDKTQSDFNFYLTKAFAYKCFLVSGSPARDEALSSLSFCTAESQSHTHSFRMSDVLLYINFAMGASVGFSAGGPRDNLQPIQTLQSIETFCFSASKQEYAVSPLR